MIKILKDGEPLKIGDVKPGQTLHLFYERGTGKQAGKFVVDDRNRQQRRKKK